MLKGLRGPGGSSVLPDNIAEPCTPAPPHRTYPTPIPDPLLRNGLDSISHLPVGPSGPTYYGQLPAPGSQAALAWNLEQRFIKEQQRDARWGWVPQSPLLQPDPG